MAFAYAGEGSPDYAPCQYGASRLVFRGPARSLAPGYVATLGGTETYGKFVHEPFPALLEGLTGRQVVNLGCQSAGPDVFLADPEVLAIASGAAAVVVQVPGAVNLSNRFYAVHPRRNDRFLRPTPELRALFPELDLTDVHFTGHLMRLVARSGGRRAEVLAEVLRETWVDRMGALLGHIGAPLVLLWLAEGAPPAPGSGTADGDPPLVDAGMLAAVARHARETVEVLYRRGHTADHSGKAFGPLEAHAAERVPGPLAHAETALALARALDAVL